ncbi:hypothetical protein [Virgisporangium aurantiacum]|uniref:DUF4760 domain-containing protein n=1 Tax=Virgisporangium aurantiacum TaxID=175570 RepID=A0A8J3ZG93_9ACTN|nr:hypothetical protein [Virgisporangium aurantiacum]GIJ62253.1 hypothetical protein Vau01_097690 [Virgisporangium aurantiacum]
MASLDVINSIAQMVGAVAVVATLPFIAVQSRVSRRIAECDSYHNLVSSVSQFYATLATVEGAADLYIRGRKEPASLEREERARFFYSCVQWFCFHENLYLQHSRGLLPRQYFAAWREAFRRDLGDPGFVAYWHHERLDYAIDFQRYVDGILANLDGSPSNLPDPREILLPRRTPED